MWTVKKINRALGPKEMSKRLGVRVTAISNAGVDNRFPGRWYRVVRDMCVEQKLDIEVSSPAFLDLFNFVDDAVKAKVGVVDK